MTGRPTVRQQRGKCVVRVDGVDTATGKPRPRQIGTYPSRRAAAVAASAAAARGAGQTGKGTKGLLRDTAKSEALAELKRWFKDRLLVDDPREAA